MKALVDLRMGARTRGAPNVIGKLPQNKRGRDCADDAGRVNQRQNVKACLETVIGLHCVGCGPC